MNTNGNKFSRTLTFALEVESIRFGLGLECVPSFRVEVTDGVVDYKRPRKREALDQFDDVGFVFEPPLRAVHPAVQFERDELFERDEQRCIRNRFRIWKHDGGVSSERAACREEVDEDAIAAVLNRVLASLAAHKRTGNVGRDEFNGFQHVGDNDVCVKSDPEVAVFLDGEPARDQMWNLKMREDLDRAFQRRVQSRCAGGLAQDVGSRIHGGNLSESPHISSISLAPLKQL